MEQFTNSVNNTPHFQKMFQVGSPPPLFFSLLGRA